MLDGQNGVRKKKTNKPKKTENFREKPEKWRNHGNNANYGGMGNKIEEVRVLAGSTRKLTK